MRVRLSRGAAAVASVALLTGCAQVDSMPYKPLTTPEEWCEQRPCVEMGGIIVAEPWSSVLVFALALLWIGIGVAFLWTRRGQASRAWFGTSLVAGGIAAASAGVSYQALSYELKCAGRDVCGLTNGFEITYSVLQVASMNAMVIAVAYALASPRVRRGISIYAIVNMCVYLVVTLAGVLMPSALLLSFELLLVFAVPSLVIVGVLAVRSRQQPIGRRILWVLVLLVAVQVAYLAYFAAGITATLWASGIYFSANDVLHVGMIGWLIAAGLALGPVLSDLPQPES